MVLKLGGENISNSNETKEENLINTGRGGDVTIKNIFPPAEGQIVINRQNASLVTNIATDTFTKVYTTTWDCGATPEVFGVTGFITSNYTKTIATGIFISIHNRSGAMDTYHILVANATKGTTMINETFTDIPNKTVAGTYYLIPIQNWDPESDVVTLTIDDGVVGTNAGEVGAGTVTYNVHQFTDASNITDWF
jgi:hypothetical protein